MSRTHCRRGLCRTAALVGLLGLAAGGCWTPARRYLIQRGQDLADSFIVEAGVGVPGHASVRLTDHAVVGLGLARVYRVGWRGTTGGGLALPGGRRMAVTDVAVPFVYNVEGGEWFYEMGERPPREVPRVVTTGLWTTERHYPEPPPPPRTRTADRFWLAVSATLGASARLGLNPVELADFLAGWATVDFLRDDRPRAADRGEAAALAARQ